MENKLTKAQVTTILQNAPKGSDPGKIVDGLVKRGYVLEGFNEPKPSLVSRAVSTVADYGKEAVTNPVETAKGVIKGIPGKQLV